MDGLKTQRTGAKGAGEELAPAPVARAQGPPPRPTSWGEELIPAARLADEFHITRRTLGNWFVNPNLSFPKPTEINGRLYFSRSAIESWKIARVRVRVSEAEGI